MASMKLGDIQKIYATLNGVLEKRLPMKIGFVINRNLKKIEPIMADLDNARNNAIEKYAERDRNGNLVVVKNGGVKIKNVEELTKELSDVLDADIEIELDKFSMDDLEKCESDGYDKLTVAEQGALECMIS